MPRHYRKSLPAVDWALLSKEFPTHAEHIIRVRNKPEKLARLSQRLIARRVRDLRQLRDGKRKIISPVLPSRNRVSISLLLAKLGLITKG
jgi:hypothetical protein